MTKERKAAIKQWETVKERIRFYGIFSKPFNEYGWYCNCWFCQYVRDHSALTYDNGCSKCPLWKWAEAHDQSVNRYTCGCTHANRTLYDKVTDKSQRRDKRIEACDLIIAALKCEKIWEKVE